MNLRERRELLQRMATLTHDEVPVDLGGDADLGGDTLLEEMQEAVGDTHDTQPAVIPAARLGLNVSTRSVRSPAPSPHRCSPALKRTRRLLSSASALQSPAIVVDIDDDDDQTVGATGSTEPWVPLARRNRGPHMMHRDYPE